MVLVVRVPGYRSRGPGSIPGATRFSEWVVLEWCALSLASTIGELLGRNSSGFGLERRDYCCTGSASLTIVHPSIHKRWH
jgi:hypothetical protein